MTTYVVLSKNGSKGWTEVGRFDASGDESAIRQAVDGKNLESDLVAVPIRSFQVRHAVTKTVVTFPKVTT